MAPSKNSIIEPHGNTSLLPLKVTGYEEQIARQRISPTWEPAGFERYLHQRALLHDMPVLDVSGQLLGNPDRYRPIAPGE